MRVKEGQTAYVELRRQRAGNRQVAVGWRVTSGTCRAGIDMQELSGTAYLAPGQLTTNIAVPVYQDRAFEGPEYFNVSLTGNPQLGSITDGTSNTVVVVEDDDFFVPLPGSYCGLLDTQGWGALVKCTVTGIGGASGTVDYMGATYRFTGSFDAYGQLVASFDRIGRPSIGLRLRFAEGWARCAASLRDPEGDWSEGFVRYLPYNGKTSIAPQVGSYTILCEGMGGGSVAAPAVMTQHPMRSPALPAGSLTAADAWILARLDSAIEECEAALGPARPANGVAWTDAERGRGLRLSEYAEAARRFVWNELADWYLESLKPRLAAESGADRDAARAVLAHAFDGALRLLQPIIPFITEALWQHLPQTPAEQFLAQAAWPVARAESSVSDAERALAALFGATQETVAAIRQIKSEYNVAPGASVQAIVCVTGVPAEAFAAQAPVIGSLARAVVTVSSEAPVDVAASIVGQLVTVHVPLAGMIDMDKERQRLSAEIAQLDGALSALLGRLGNEKFVAKAPPAVVEGEKAKAAEWQSRLTSLQQQLEKLGA